RAGQRGRIHRSSRQPCRSHYSVPGTWIRGGDSVDQFRLLTIAWPKTRVAMKTILTIAFATVAAVQWVGAATTINATNRFSYGANIGWIDWRGDKANGAIIGEYVCSDYIYSANVGWIHLGNGMPTNGVYYGNLSAADYGVNHDGIGRLRGYAYGANIGW